MIILIKLLPGFISKQLAAPMIHAIPKAYFSPIYRVIGFMIIETKKPETYIIIGIKAT